MTLSVTLDDGCDLLRSSADHGEDIQALFDLWHTLAAEATAAFEGERQSQRDGEPTLYY